MVERELRSRNRKDCVGVDNCDTEVVDNFFEGLLEGTLRHREDIEKDIWRMLGERNEETIDVMLGLDQRPTETENINWLIYL